MKPLILLSLLAALSLPATAQKKLTPRLPATKPVIIGQIDTLQAKILNEKRALWIYVPHQLTASNWTQPGPYPVIYALDGDTHFHSLTGLVQFMSRLGTIPLSGKKNSFPTSRPITRRSLTGCLSATRWAG